MLVPRLIHLLAGFHLIEPQESVLVDREIGQDRSIGDR